jgi:hypothetical protein
MLRGMKNSLLALSLLVLVPVASGCGSSSSTPAATPAGTNAPDLSGKWQSACTPMSDTQGFVLDFDLTDKTWGLDYVVYGDKACTSKFLTVRIEGPYEVGSASKTVAGAHDARFAFTKKTITPHSAAAAGYLASDAGCNQPGFAEGVAKDVGATGCANLGQRPISACPADYDLVKVDGDTLFFGARPADNDMCTEAKRPTAISQLGSKRK